jgi:hypothetical protein
MGGTSNAFQVRGTNEAALFTLRVHRGEGMCLLAMNWKNGKPPLDFVGFAIEYKEPGGDRFFAVRNRLSFPDAKGKINPNTLSSRLSPIQKFRWIHFPPHADLPGDFEYKVTPVFMNTKDELSYGEPQKVLIQLRHETYPNQLNVTFTRGFVSSQAFVDKFGGDKAIPQLLPAKAAGGLTFKATHPQKEEAWAWMGFEAREALLDLLDQAIADTNAKVSVVAYDLNEPGIASRLVQLGSRLRVIIDEGDEAHSKPGAVENQAETMLVKSAGRNNVKRQKMGNLQHNKTIVVDGVNFKAAVGGSTNFSWRGFFVQNNNAMIVFGPEAIKPFQTAFENYWTNKNNSAATFGGTPSAQWSDLGLTGINAKVAFSPHTAGNALLKSIADDISETTSSLFFSLAFLYQTKGPIRNAIIKIKDDDNIFSYGLSDKAVEGLSKEEDLSGEKDGVELTKPNGKVSVVQPALLKKNVPEPFKTEASGGIGTRLHHKFVVIDFDKPTARVYTGSYNFSGAADTSNGENLWLIKDQRIATAYVVEAVSMFDHYHFRVIQESAKKGNTTLSLDKPPHTKKGKPWWNEDYTDTVKILDRELFA